MVIFKVGVDGTPQYNTLSDVVDAINASEIADGEYGRIVGTDPSSGAYDTLVQNVGGYPSWQGLLPGSAIGMQWVSRDAPSATFDLDANGHPRMSVAAAVVDNQWAVLDNLKVIRPSFLRLHLEISTSGAATQDTGIRPGLLEDGLTNPSLDGFTLSGVQARGAGIDWDLSSASGDGGSTNYGGFPALANHTDTLKFNGGKDVWISYAFDASLGEVTDYGRFHLVESGEAVISDDVVLQTNQDDVLDGTRIFEIGMLIQTGSSGGVDTQVVLKGIELYSIRDVS